MANIWKTSVDNLVRYSQLGSEYEYSSCHFLLPKELSEKIIRWAIETIPESLIVYDSKDPGTKGIQLESHITLKYGLLTDDFEDVKKALENEKAPHLKFNKTSFFEPEGKDYDVVIIPVESEDLQKLNKKLCSQVEYEDLQFKEYHPHVTVAYVKKGLGKKFDGKDIITGEELDLGVLIFSPKEGEKRNLELVKKTEKESSFMPSNTDLAPSNDWIGEVGYPGNSEMDAPQNVSDEETWYSPENDRPRTKTFWQKMLSLFQKPLSKKEPAKDIVPVKEASIKKEASDKRAWVDPNGKVFYTEGDIHASWVNDNLEFLERDYGFKVPKRVWNQRMKYYKLMEEGQENVDLPDIWEIEEAMFNSGWVRIGDVVYDKDIGIELKNLRTIPSFLDSILPQFVRDGQPIVVEDRPKNSVTVTYPFKSLQQAVNKALSSPTKTAILKEGERYLRAWWLSPDGQVYDVQINHAVWAKDNIKLLETKYGYSSIKSVPPGFDYTFALVEKGWVRVGILLFNSMLVELNNLRSIPTFVFDFLMEKSGSVKEVVFEDINNKTVSLSIDQLPEGQKAINKALMRKTAKQWVTPTDHVNQPGMDWGWADYIYNYVDETWQDLLHDWLELDPKNYVKPIVLIEQIYKDEGAVSAWVRIEFVNTAENTDAFMKLVISGDVHYEPSYEPEGVETTESLENIEVDVKDFGKTDELEKAGGYGPTNYKGPSVADELYQDSPYRMNVTYSPEENDENFKQNGKGGYPQRFMGLPKGKYYTNQGEVLNMLEKGKCPHCGSYEVEESNG